MGTVPDAKTYTPLKNISVMYMAPQAGGTVGNGIRCWAYGAGSRNPTDGTLVDKISMATYRGLRVAASNQFITVAGS